MQGGEEVRRISFDYTRRGVGHQQRHQVRLLRGDYTVLVELTFQGAIPEALRGAALGRTRGPEVVRLERPLVVRGGGEAAVYIAEER